MLPEGSYRLSAHAVIERGGRILQVKATYGDKGWGLPGGTLEPGETIHEALARECEEELGVLVSIRALTGVYYHKAFNSHVFIFHCEEIDDTAIKLSSEHSEFRYFAMEELSAVQRIRVNDCLNYDGCVRSARF